MNEPISRIRRAMLGAVPAALFGAPAFAQAFPSKPITLVCPFTAGGTADVQLRVLAAAAGKELGVPVVVETRAGAAGTLGPASIVSAAPDGYTLSMATGIALLRQPFIVPTRYDPAKDFTYILGVTRFELGLAVRADAPWRNLAEFVADAKKNPGKFAYGTAGAATGQHTAMLRLCDAAGIACTHIPYKGSGDVFNALAGGHVQAISETSGWAPFVDSGKFRLLAVYSESRLKRWPSAPTAKEQGYDVTDSVPWGIVGPAGMSAALTKTLHDAFHKSLSDAAFVKTLALVGQEPWDADSTAYRNYMVSRIPVERDLVAKYRLKER
ncbi:tripartite tricarboxylate transporter substrate binding protein [Caenimonas sp. S4]|nr:tripartite tricarboxylate transporter substrate binding protein [Caenimonas soli]